MKRFIFMYVLVFGGITALAQSKIDTTYYDNNWKGIDDPHAFIFTCEGIDSKRYHIKEGYHENVFKLFRPSEENLFEIGRKDIVIKKENKKEKSTCRQEAFDYKGKENVLGKKW